MRVGLGRNWGVAALLAAALAGCGGAPDTTQSSDPGVLTLRLRPTHTAVDGLELDSATMRLEHVQILGDVPAGDRSMLSSADVDLLGAASQYEFTMLPQGVYSRVRCVIDRLRLEGAWRGTPLRIDVDSDDEGLVDLRTAAAQELAPGHDVAITAAIDVGSWFAGALLDQATPIAGQIFIDEYANRSVATQLAGRALASVTLEDAPVP
jgi:hypothetical protein